MMTVRFPKNDESSYSCAWTQENIDESANRYIAHRLTPVVECESDRSEIYIGRYQFHRIKNGVYAMSGYIAQCGQNKAKKKLEKFKQEVANMESVEKVCAQCGEVIEGDDGYFVDGKWYCSDDCLSYNDYEFCAQCNCIEHVDDLIWIEDDENYVCNTCYGRYEYFECDHCGKHYSHSSLSMSDSSRSICDNCERYYVVCAGCGDVIHEDDAYYNDYDDCYYCEYCNERHSSPILSYHDDAADYSCFLDMENPNGNYGERPGKRYLGYELEVDKGNSAHDFAEYVNNHFDHMYCMHDGSLSNSGVELISWPATLEWHMKEGNWDKLCRVAVEDYNYKSHDTDTCGLHVHVNRASFGDTFEERDLNIAKLILLVNRFWNKRIVPFTRRKVSNLERWASKNFASEDILVTDTEREIVDKVLDGAEGDRYHAINLCNSDTVEFRIFRGTLKYSTLIATLQFVDTICEFVKHVSLSDLDNVKWEDIFADVDYPELIAYLKEKTQYNPAEPQLVDEKVPKKAVVNASAPVPDEHFVTISNPFYQHRVTTATPLVDQQYRFITAVPPSRNVEGVWTTTTF